MCPRIAQDYESDTTFVKIAVYPNPSSSEFKIRLRTPAVEEGSFSLMTLSGVVAKQSIIQKGVQWITVKTDDIFPGFYLVRINDGSQEYYRKVLIEH